MTRSEFLRRQTELKRLRGLSEAVLVFGLCLVIVLTFIFRPFLAQLSPRAWAIAIVGFTAIYAPIIEFWRSRLPRRLGLQCPGCMRALDGSVSRAVKDSGKCSRCGVNVIDADQPA